MAIVFKVEQMPFFTQGVKIEGVFPTTEKLYFSCLSAGNFLFPTRALWTSIRHDQPGVNIGLREDTHRETLTMSLCNIIELDICLHIYL